MVLDITLITLGIICIIIGIVGCIMPVIPGVPLNYLGIILLQFTSQVQFSTHFLIVWGIVVVIVQILDYYVPVWGTKRFGGGKKGIWGSIIGVIAGIFIFPPWGIIICPFVGAVIGELLDKKEINAAIKAGFGAFLGFVAGTLMKLIVAIILSFYFFKELISAFL